MLTKEASCIWLVRETQDSSLRRPSFGMTKSYRVCPLPFTTHFSVTNFSKAKGPRA